VKRPIDVEVLNWGAARRMATLKCWRPCLSIEIEERHRVGHPRVPELFASWLPKAG
jgi:hypothetical protein